MSRQEVSALKYRRMPIEEESPEQLPEELEGGLAAVSASIRAALTT